MKHLVRDNQISDKAFQVICNNCETSGPCVSLREKAIENWNSLVGVRSPDEERASASELLLQERFAVEQANILIGCLVGGLNVFSLGCGSENSARYHAADRITRLSEFIESKLITDREGRDEA